MEYSQAGNYTALAGLAVVFLAKFGIVTDNNSVIAIIAGVVALVGIVRQFRAHKALAQAAGAFPKA